MEPRMPDINHECWNCGKTAKMRIIGSVLDEEIIEDEQFIPSQAGTDYELLECRNCKKITLRSAWWHDGMEDPSELQPSVLFPTPRHYEAEKALERRKADRQWMEMAVKEARKCVPEKDKITPFVAAVVAKGLEFIGAAYRGELKPGEHAEYTLLEEKCKDITLVGATIYTTLEPCTTRNPPKLPCVERILDRKISRVVIGMLDPNDVIRGRGVLSLRKAGVQVDLFPPDLMDQLEELNRAFLREHIGEAKPQQTESKESA